MRWRGVGMMLAIGASMVVGAQSAHAALPDPNDDPFYAPPADVGSDVAGQVIRSRRVTAKVAGLPLDATSWQVLYKTVDNTGTPTATVATILVPRGAPPRDGRARPLLSYQYADDGASRRCGPAYSLAGPLAAQVGAQTVESKLVGDALARGWTVVAADHEGPTPQLLGADGQGRAVLDGIRAARTFGPAGVAASAPVALWGYSEGAYVTSVAAQMQPTYAPDLKLSGVATGGLLADVRADLRSLDGTAFGGLDALALVTLNRAYPEYHLPSYLNANGRRALTTDADDCATDALLRHPFAKMADFSDDPDAILSGAALAPMFDRASPITRPGVPAAPVYDYHAVTDENVPIEQDRRLVDRFCRAGVTVDHVELVADHVTGAVLGAPAAERWLADRFAGRPAPSTCG